MNSVLIVLSLTTRNLLFKVENDIQMVNYFSVFLSLYENTELEMLQLWIQKYRGLLSSRQRPMDRIEM